MTLSLHELFSLVLYFIFGFRLVLLSCWLLGTAHVIQACVEENVTSLVHTSTVDVVIGYDDIEEGDESLPLPPKFLFEGYPDTKHRAELLVTEANGRRLARGQWKGSK